MPGAAVHYPRREVVHGLECDATAAALRARDGVMQITDIVLGLAAGVGIDLSPDGKIAYYVEWSIGEFNRVEVDTGSVTTVLTALSSPQDVEQLERFASEIVGRFGPGR
jgi:hypothetical protein